MVRRSKQAMVVEWVEELVEGLRRQLGITGFPTREDLATLVRLLREWVEVYYWERQTATCFYREEGPALACIPKAAEGWEHDEAVGEEMGHGRLTCGVGQLLE